MSSAHVKIVVAFIGALAVIVVALIQRDGPAKTEYQSPPVQVNPQIQMNPQIIVNPQIQLAPQTQSRQSALPSKTSAPTKPISALTISPSTSNGKISEEIPTLNLQYRLIGFTPEDTALLTASLNRLQITSAEVSLLNAARAGGRNILISVVQGGGRTYEDYFGVSGTNVVPVITRRLSESLARGTQ